MKIKNAYRDTKSWNPFVGCRFNCVYCKPSFQNLIAWIGRMRHCEQCKNYGPHEHPERLTRIPRDRAIFVCEDSDISFANPGYMKSIFQAMKSDNTEDRTWFLQSKNPKCLGQYVGLLPENAYLLTTLETNRNEGYGEISRAPPPSERYKDFLSLKWNKKMVTVEPIMNFDVDTFSDWILSIAPEAVFIGYNSHPKKVQLPEPEKKKTWQLIHTLEKNGIQVLKKEMRDKRVRKKAYRDF